MHALHERAHENERKVLTYLASFDCLPKRLIALLLHGEETNSSITYAERITKRMIANGLIGRKIAGDGVYRYFLAERGTYAASELLRFEPKNGFERSYLNAARYDLLNETVIADMHALNNSTAVAFGKGALRHLFDGRFKDVDAAITIVRVDIRRFTNLYVKIDTLAESSIERYDRVSLLARQHVTKVKIIGPDFVKKKLEKKKVAIPIARI